MARVYNRGGELSDEVFRARVIDKFPQERQVRLRLFADGGAISFGEDGSDQLWAILEYR